MFSILAPTTLSLALIKEKYFETWHWLSYTHHNDNQWKKWDQLRKSDNCDSSACNQFNTMEINYFFYSPIYSYSKFSNFYSMSMLFFILSSSFGWNRFWHPCIEFWLKRMYIISPHHLSVKKKVVKTPQWKAQSRSKQGFEENCNELFLIF